MTKRYMDKSWLYDQFVVCEKSTKDISIQENVTAMTVRRWLKRFSIDDKCKEKTRLLQDKSWLNDLYTKKEKTTIEISNILNVSPGTISRWLKKHDIPIRNNFSGKNNPFFGKTHSRETKNRLSALKVGKKHSAKTKAKISRSNLGKHNDDKNPSKRPEVRKKISKGIKLYYEQNPDARKALSNNMKKRLSNKRNHPNFGNRGNNSFGWKAPEKRLTTVSKRIRGHERYVLWRKTVFERDNYTCQICNVKNTYLNADHIKPLSVIIRNNNIVQKNLNYKIETCEELWDTNNGRTLCVECHKNTDTFAYKCRKRS